MPPRRRGRGRLQLEALQGAMSAPGADPRPYVILGRVDDDEDAISWEEGVGWIVDVTPGHGDHAGEDPIPCRVARQFLADERGESQPITPGAEVVVLVPGGDLPAGGVIVGMLANATDLRVPREVNGETIDEAFSQATWWIVADHDLDWSLGATLRIAVEDRARVLAQNLELAEEGASQSFVRGDDQAAALKDVLDAINTFAQAVQSTMTGAPFPKPGLTAAATALQTQIEAAKTAIDQALSSRIKGE